MIRGKSVEFFFFFVCGSERFQFFFFFVLSVNKINLIKCKIIKEEKLIIKEKINKLICFKLESKIHFIRFSFLLFISFLLFHWDSDNLSHLWNFLSFRCNKSWFALSLKRFPFSCYENYCPSHYHNESFCNLLNEFLKSGWLSGSKWNFFGSFTVYCRHLLGYRICLRLNKNF